MPLSLTHLLTFERHSMNAPITIEDLEAVLAWPHVDPDNDVEFLEYENLRLAVELGETQARLRGIMTACFAG